MNTTPNEHTWPDEAKAQEGGGFWRIGLAVAIAVMLIFGAFFTIRYFAEDYAANQNNPPKEAPMVSIISELS
jgi:hypothetical protein